MHDNRQTDDSGTESVEDGWKTALVDHGVDEGDAEHIVSMLQSSPPLVLGSPSEDEVEEALRTAIEEIEFEQFGAEHPQRMTSALLRVLDEWRDGTRGPPVAAAPESSPTDWEARIERSDVETGGTDDDSAPPDRDATDPAETSDGEASVTTIQGDPISPEPDFDPRADPGQEAVSGSAGPINDEQGIVENAVEATAESDSDQSEAAATDADSDEDESEMPTEQSGGSADDESETNERQQKINLKKTIAHDQFNQNKEVINSWTEQPAELVEDEVASFGVRAINVYRHMVKTALFPGMSDTEQELLYEKLVEDRIRERLNSE